MRLSSVLSIGMLKILGFIKPFFSKDSDQLIFDDVYDLNDSIVDYASKLQEASHEKYIKTKSNWSPFAREIFTRTHEQIVTNQRAILCLAENGWAHVSQPNMRTMIEGLVNCVIIAREDSEFRAFKYVVFEHLRMADINYPAANPTPSTDEELTQRVKTEVGKLVSHLTSNNQDRAIEYIKRKKRGLYWYEETYKGPREAIKNEAPTLLLHYDVGGSASHGGQIGYKFFDSDPYVENINRRKDKKAANTVVMISLRYLLEFNLLRNNFEKLNMGQLYSKYLEKLLQLRKIIES